MVSEAWSVPWTRANSGVPRQQHRSTSSEGIQIMVESDLQTRGFILCSFEGPLVRLVLVDLGDAFIRDNLNLVIILQTRISLGHDAEVFLVGGWVVLGRERLLGLHLLRAIDNKICLATRLVNGT